MKVTILIKSLIVLFYAVNFAANAQEFTTKKAPENATVSGKWGTICDKLPNDGNKEVCFASQTLILQENNSEVLYIAIGKLPGVKEPMLAMTTPLRTFLPAGITIKIDDNPKQVLPHEFCDNIGCHLRVGVKPEVIESMKKGNKINIEFRDGIGQKLAIPVSLKGFTKAYQELKFN